MNSEKRKAKRFGLIGKRLDYSFSKKYFTRKFEQEDIHASYQNLEMNDLSELKKQIEENNISGFNITNPFKEKIFPLLDSLTKNAQEIGAVNCVEITPEKKWIGHNTDVIGFEKSVLNLIKKNKPKALIFGTGGVSQAVQFVLHKLNVEYQLISRNNDSECISYNDLNEESIAQYKLLVNTTPVGTTPNTEDCIDIPYQHITDKHFCFDMVYNPEKSQFLTRAQDRGANIKNGLEMLEIQAEESWKIWNS